MPVDKREKELLRGKYAQFLDPTATVALPVHFDQSRLSYEPKFSFGGQIWKTPGAVLREQGPCCHEGPVEFVSLIFPVLNIQQLRFVVSVGFLIVIFLL